MHHSHLVSHDLIVVLGSLKALHEIFPGKSKDELKIPQVIFSYLFYFFFQAEDGIRDPLWSRGLGDVYKRQDLMHALHSLSRTTPTLLADDS